MNLYPRQIGRPEPDPKMWTLYDPVAGEMWYELTRELIEKQQFLWAERGKPSIVIPPKGAK
jgi:hypothetical protein